MRFQRGFSILSIPTPARLYAILIARLLLHSSTHSHSSSPMSSNNPRYMVFESRTQLEEQWSAREELFNAHGYRFRPRLRKDWTPSWFTTGISPLDSEDGELLKVR